MSKNKTSEKENNANSSSNVDIYDELADLIANESRLGIFNRATLLKLLKRNPSICNLLDKITTELTENFFTTTSGKKSLVA
jgi:hypothetical protein